MLGRFQKSGIEGIIKTVAMGFARRQAGMIHGRTIMKSEYLVQQMTDTDLTDKFKVDQMLNKVVYTKSRRSQSKGLYHTKAYSRKINSCFSEKKSVYIKKPNIHKKRLWSDVLGQNIRLSMTTHAMRAMRRRGSFDNYILMTHPTRLDSIYGEYLRRLMLNKLNNPDYQIPEIKGQNSRVQVRGKYRKLNELLKRGVFHPKEIRHIDLTMHKPKMMNHYNRREFLDHKQIFDIRNSQQDIDFTHPVIARYEDENKLNYQKILPIAEQLSKEYDEGYLKRRYKLKANLQDIYEKALFEVRNPMPNEEIEDELDHDEEFMMSKAKQARRIEKQKEKKERKEKKNRKKK